MGRLACAWLLHWSVPSGTTTLSPEETSFNAISSGTTTLSPEGMTFLSWNSLRFEQMVKRSPSNLFSSTPWRPTRLHQIHFGSAPATECVLWHIACQGGAEKVSPWQETPLRVRSKPHCLPKWICGASLWYNGKITGYSRKCIKSFVSITNTGQNSICE